MKKIASLTLAGVALLLVLMGRLAARGPAPRADFGINCAQDTLRTRPGWPLVTFQLSLVGVDGYQGPVRLTCVTFNPHLTCEVSPPAVSLGGDSVAPFVVTAWADPATKAPSVYPLLVNAKGESRNIRAETPSHTQTLHLVVGQ